jgi:hypothetical protein
MMQGPIPVITKKCRLSLLSVLHRREPITRSIDVELFPICRLLTDPIFLDRIPDPDPFEKLDLIPHSDPPEFSGSPIRSHPTYRSIWLLRDQKCFSFGLGKLV